MAGQFPIVVRPIHKYLVMACPSSTTSAVRQPRLPDPNHSGTRRGRFCQSMAYGKRGDWCQNVLAARSAQLDLKDETVSLINPRVLTREETASMVPQDFERRFPFFHHYLYAQRAEIGGPLPKPSPAEASLVA